MVIYTSSKSIAKFTSVPALKRKSLYLIAWDVGIGAAVLLGGLIAEISSFDDAFILGLIMLFFSAVLYMKVIGPQYEKNRLR